MTPPLTQRRQHAAGERDRQGQEDQRRQAPAPEGGLQQQEDADRSGDRDSRRAGSRSASCRRRRRGPRRGTRAGTRRRSSRVRRRRRRRRASRPPRRRRRRRSARPPRGWITVGLGPIAHVGDVAEAHVAAARRVDQQVADARQAVRASRARPRPRPRRPSAPRTGCRPRCPDSSVAAARRTSPGLTPSCCGRREVDLDLERRLLDWQLDARSHDAVDAADDAARTSLGLALAGRPGPGRRPGRRASSLGARRQRLARAARSG